MLRNLKNKQGEVISNPLVYEIIEAYVWVSFILRNTSSYIIATKIM